MQIKVKRYLLWWDEVTLASESMAMPLAGARLESLALSR